MSNKLAETSATQENVKTPVNDGVCSPTGICIFANDRMKTRMRSTRFGVVSITFQYNELGEFGETTPLTPYFLYWMDIGSASRTFSRNTPLQTSRSSGNSSLHSICPRQFLPPDSMDSVKSLLNGDLSIWGVLAMPLGVALCFGPVLLVWLKEELGSPEKHKDRK